MADANVYVRYLADASRLVTENRKAERSSRKAGKGVDEAEQGLGRFAARAATFVAGSAALGIMGSWISEGTKMAETADLIRGSWEKTFGEAGQTLNRDLEKTRRGLGLAEYEMQQLLVTTGQLAQQQGLTKDESADFANQLFTMAGDVAAFTGKLDEAPNVLNAFQAALRGEFDPLEQYGIKLSAAAIEAEALRINVGKTSAELTAADKTTATLTLITEALGDEYGALGEAAESGATKANEAAADQKDAQEAVGQSFQEVARILDQALASVFRGLEWLGKAIGGSMARFSHWADNAEGAVGAVARFVSDLWEAFMRVGDGAERLRSRFNAAFRAMLSPVRAVQSAVGGLRSRISSAWSSLGNLASRGRGLLGFQTGGVVPGPTGTAQLAVVHGGERVLTPQQQRGAGMGGGNVYNITVNAGLSDPHGTATAIVDLLRMYQRTQGDVPALNNVGS